MQTPSASVTMIFVKPRAGISVNVLAGAACLLTFLLSGCSTVPSSPATSVDAGLKVSAPAFEVIPLGTAGGLDESNLSSYLISRGYSHRYIAFDAGSVMTGLKVAAANGAFATLPVQTDLTVEGNVLTRHITGYALSHAHLDHVAGMVINATDDTPKPVYAMPSTIKTLKENVFNWALWPNFTNEGSGYKLNRYRYTYMQAGEAQTLGETGCSLTAYPLSHAGADKSSAFLYQCDDNAVLYLGDTGPDAMEGTGQLAGLWKTVAPLIKSGRLKGVFIEASYPSDREDNALFGHLTPAWLMRELDTLAALTDSENPASALRGLKIIITHIKPSLNKQENTLLKIKSELEALNSHGVTLIFPQQGEPFYL